MQVIDDLDEIHFTMKKARQVIRDMTRSMMTDKCAGLGETAGWGRAVEVGEWLGECRPKKAAGTGCPGFWCCCW